MMMPLLSGHGINSHTPLAAGDPPHAALRRKEDNAIGCGKGDERWWRQQGVSLDVARNKKWKTKVRCLPMSDHEHESSKWSSLSNRLEICSFPEC